MADAALALNIAVGQEGVVGGTVGLRRLALLDVAVLPEAGENVLDDGRVLGRGSATEDVELDPEPVVNVLVNGMILGAQGGRIHALRERLCLGRRAVLIRTADIHGWQTSCPAEAGEHVCRLE